MMAENGNIVPVVAFFDKARKTVIDQGYGPEIDYVQNRFLKDMDVDSFFWETAFVILSSSGLKEQIVRKNFDKFRNAFEKGDGNSYSLIPNGRQREAIHYVENNATRIFLELINRPTDPQRIELLDALPQIGPITKYHLARNLGIDCIKPDIWLKRLCDEYGFWDIVNGEPDPNRMCETIRRERQEFRIGTIDVILWRYCNLTGALS